MSRVMRRRERNGAVALLTTAMVWLAGCGGEIRGVDELGTASQALRCHDGAGNPVNDANCPWKFLSRQTPSTPANDISHRRSPALCGGNNFVTVSVDSNSQYRTLQWHWLSASSWMLYGASKTFASRPACTQREEDVPGQSGFVIAGKSNDNKIYASAGLMALGTSPQQNPSWVTPFEAVSNTTYTNGGPALATGGFDTPAVVLVFMGDDRRIYAHTRKIPYLDNTWSSRITGPQLPTGWNPVGAPSIARLPITFQIVVHARNGTQDRLFETHFFVNSQHHFSSGIGSPEASWTMLADMGRIDDEPALTYHESHGSTVYFRRYDPFTQKSQIMQTSGFPLGANPVLAVKPNANINFDGSPAATASWAYESQNGLHTMIARTTSNQLYVGTTNIDSSIVP